METIIIPQRKLKNKERPHIEAIHNQIERQRMLWFELLCIKGTEEPLPKSMR